jgi:hypothetical protein
MRRRTLAAPLLALVVFACEGPTTPPHDPDPASVEVSPPSLSLMEGETAPFTAVVRNASGVQIQAEIAWAVEDTTRATITAGGLLTARRAGVTQVTATASTVTAGAAVTVTYPPGQIPAAVQISPASLALRAGDQHDLQAVVLNAAGDTLSVEVSWTTTTPALVEISGSGVLTALRAGEAVVVASAGSASSSLPVSISTGPPAKVTVTPLVLELFTPEQRLLAAVVSDVGGSVLSEPVVWSSSDSGVATVNEQGLVRPQAPGAVTITATTGAVSGDARLTVVAPLALRFPLEGTLNEDFFFTNYVDLQPGSGLLDYQCGLKTYAGHNGVDIVLPDFARMDRGVNILASAPGTVTHVQDGHFDRHKSWDSSAPSNLVILEHRDGFRSAYLHMQNGSVAVSVGQVVEAGTLLGRVGSSGMSDMPHLHFELQRHGDPLEAHAGECGPSFSHWADPTPYQDAFRLFDLGLTRDLLTLARVKDPPTRVESFSGGEQLRAWVQLLNVRPGQISTFRLRNQGGAVQWTYSFSHSQFYSLSWWWVNYTLPASSTGGVWTMEYLHDGVLWASRTFQLQPAGARELPAPEGSPSTHGGGGWRSHVMPPIP